ncbi:MAG: DNA polymerase III subunit gamma/tau [Idiomarina sp.]|nr:DNA polymerase III subunit gamma/tau [Idiomarina sp.]
MSYQVLARKWRPRNFSEVVGQQHVLQALTNALTHQRLHHAYLLTGTRGVGKTTIARILSRSLNCDKGITATPCGECSACVDIEAGRFVDLMEIDAASRTKVEDTREILENVQYRPTAGRYKVYLIDEVHMLSRHSFNALLKTLEEPPPHVIFLLATTDPEKLPVTVLSRCLQFNLRALTREEISTQLQHILTAEKIRFDESALALLARSANGSMRDALSLTDQAIAQGNNEVLEASVARMLGRIDHANLLDLLASVADGNVNATLQSLRELVDKIPDIAGVLTELQTMLHQLALAQVAPALLDSELLARSEQLAALAQKIDPATVQVYYRTVLDGRRELPYAPDAFSGVEMTLLRMLAFRPAVADATSSSGAPTAGKPEAVTSSPVKAAETVSVAEGMAEAEAEVKAEPAESTAQVESAIVQQERAQAEAVQQPAEKPEAMQPEAEQQAAAEPDAPVAASKEAEAEQPASAQPFVNSAVEEHEVPAYLDDDEDDDDSAALFAEQAGIEQQASAVRPAAEPEATTAVSSASVSAGAAPESSAAPSLESADLTSLMATRKRLAAKKGSESASVASKPATATDAVVSKPNTNKAPLNAPQASAEPAAVKQEPSAGEQEPSAVEQEPSAVKQELSAVKQEPSAPQQTGETHEPVLASKPANEQEPATETAADVQQTTSGKVIAAAQVDAWAAQIEKLAVVGRTRQVLLHSQLHEQPQGYVLEVSADMQALLSGHMNASIKNELATVIANKELEIKLGNPQRTPFQIQQEINAALQADAEKRVAEHPGIQQLQSSLAAEVKQVTVLH